MTYQIARFATGSLAMGDCMEVMRAMPSASVDMVLTDLPYGTTQNKWDAVIPFAPMWEQLKRIRKSSAAIVLTAAQPFTSTLVCSNIAEFRYDWTWQKEKGTGHLNAKRMPMRDKEDVLVFYAEQPVYYPQWGKGIPFDGNARVGRKQQTSSYGAYEAIREDSDGKRYPKQVLQFNSVGRGGIHPTQKPVELFEYMIRTYTNPNDVVLDITAGVCTTAVAAINAGRRWLCIEQDATHAMHGFKRVQKREAQ